MSQKKGKPKKKRTGISARKVEKYLADADKAGNLDPRHEREFDRMLDDLVPPAPPPKKKRGRAR